MENKSESEMDEDEDSHSDDSFVLYKVKEKINQAMSKVSKKTHLIANTPYRIKQHQAFHVWTHVQMSTFCQKVSMR